MEEIGHELSRLGASRSFGSEKFGSEVPKDSDSNDSGYCLSETSGLLLPLLLASSSASGGLCWWWRRHLLLLLLSQFTGVVKLRCKQSLKKKRGRDPNNYIYLWFVCLFYFILVLYCHYNWRKRKRRSVCGCGNDGLGCVLRFCRPRQHLATSHFVSNYNLFPTLIRIVRTRHYPSTNWCHRPIIGLEAQWLRFVLNLSTGPVATALFSRVKRAHMIFIFNYLIYIEH